MVRLVQALTIATSDSGGGAGIQADIKTLHANHVYALSVVVAVTAQNTKFVSLVHALPLEVIEAQITAVFDDFEISAVKTGMLFSAEIVAVVAARLREYGTKALVVDPVMISKDGSTLLKPDAILRMKEDLFPLAALVTPNIEEAERLTGASIRTIDDAREAARRIHALGCRAVLVKGGHLPTAPATDVLYDGRGFTVIPGEFIDTTTTHGTGCTLSAAITAQLARGRALIDAVFTAKRYVAEAIRHGLTIGHGHGPTHHFHSLPENPTQ